MAVGPRPPRAVSARDWWLLVGFGLAVIVISSAVVTAAVLWWR